MTMRRGLVFVLILLSSSVVAGISHAGPVGHSVGGRDTAQAESFQTAQLLRRLLGRDGEGRDGEGRGRRERQEEEALLTRNLSVGGVDRTYYLYVPDQVRGSRAPLIIAFHGGGGRALPFARRIGLREMAERHGYVVAAPEGLKGWGSGGSWNVGSAEPSGYAEESRTDDLGFVEAMIADIGSLTPVDPSRTYAMGLSKGGMMAYHAACELPGRFAAIAAVAATLSSENCRAPAGVGLLHIHGTADQNVPWEGGRGSLTGGDTVWPPVERGISIWTGANQCSALPAAQSVASDTTCQRTRCGTGETVEICRVQGGGHAWPGTDPTKWQQKTSTHVSPHFDATEYIADFFDAN